MSHASPQPGHVRLALCQLPVGSDKEKNIETARSYLERAKGSGAQLAILPECFNCPYDTNVFEKYAEPISKPSVEVDQAQELRLSPTIHALRKIAKDTGMFLVGGSIPELDADGKIYNTSVTLSPAGTILAKHRKVHLFDVDVPGGIRFKESDALAAGDKLTVFDGPTPATASRDDAHGSQPLRVGIGICYDIRFPELSMSMARSGGAALLVFPGAFNMTTGPAHWELLARARAVDNQVYVAVCSPARWDENATYTPWGHSTVVDPWGTVVATTEHAPDIVLADIDLSRIRHVRGAIPTQFQRRQEVYSQALV